MTATPKALERLDRVRAALRPYRGPLLAAGVAIFLAGAWWAFGQLRLSPDDIRPRFLILLILMMPLSLLYSGVGLLIIARSGGVHMRLGQATGIACHAVLAEALPIPGGAIVRSGALMAKGVGMVRSVALVTANALLWIALAAVGAGVAILPFSMPGGAVLLGMGAVGVAAVMGWLTSQAGMRIALYSLAHRLAGVLLLTLRLFLAFQAIGVALPFMKAFPVTLAIIAGSAASITPAGLGISEMLGALIAGVVQLNPAAAFVAVGLDRLLALIASGVGAFVFHVRQPTPASPR